MSVLSIAIPTCESHGQGGKFITDLLNSIAQQTLHPFEICISDHSENDEVKNAIAQLTIPPASLLPQTRIRYQRNPNNRGNSPANTNAAIAMCTGDVIKIMFQDDVMIVPHVLELTQKLFQDPNVNWVAFPNNQTNQDLTKFYSARIPQWNTRIHEGVNTISSPSVIAVRHSGIRKHNIAFDETLRVLMDCDYYCKLYAAFGPPIVPKGPPCIANREHDGQLSNTLPKEKNAEDRLIAEIQKCKRKYDELMKIDPRSRMVPPPQPTPKATAAAPRGLCINLARRLDRWTAFQKQQHNPSTHGFFANTRRFDAVDGPDTAPALPKTEAGALGCTLSHIGALQKLAATAASPDELVMVVEDDILITSSPLLQKLMQQLPTLATAKDWAVLVLASSSGRLVPTATASAQLGLSRIVGAASTTGYLLRVRHIPMLVNIFQRSAAALRDGQSRRTAALDVMWLGLQQSVPFICCPSPLATQRAGHSDIEQHNVDYSPLFLQTKRPLQWQSIAASPTSTPSRPCSATPTRSAPGRPVQTPVPHAASPPRRPPAPPPAQS